MHEHVASLMNFLINLKQILLSFIKLKRVATELSGISISNALCCTYDKGMFKLYGCESRENNETSL